MEEVILVNKKDEKIGTEEKMKAHREGKLHRAFSIFIFNSKGELLLQQRAETKYHAPGLWSNTCCGHPRPGEETGAAAVRRLKEEMGIDGVELKEVFSLAYDLPVSGLVEKEFDHIFFGRFDGQPRLNPEEAQDFRWVNLEELKRDIEKNEKKYTPWLRVILKSPKFKIDHFRANPSNKLIFI